MATIQDITINNEQEAKRMLQKPTYHAVSAQIDKIVAEARAALWSD
jgi:hypothetical protein